MDPLTLIIAALAAGASRGLTDTAADAVGDLYGRLKAAISQKFERNAKAEAALADYGDDPKIFEKPLQKYLKETDAITDTSIVDLAQALLAQADPQGAKVGKYNVDVRGAQNVLIGDNGTQNIHP